MPPRDSGNTFAACIALRDNRRFDLRWAFPPLARAREYIKPRHALSHRIITQDCHRVRLTFRTHRQAHICPHRLVANYAAESSPSGGEADTIQPRESVLCRSRQSYAAPRQI
jgi:hypothetical protein